MSAGSTAGARARTTAIVLGDSLRSLSGTAKDQSDSATDMPLSWLRPDGRAFTVFLGLLAALPTLSIDLSAPTLPVLPGALHTTVTMAGLTISLFMAGFAAGQLVAGPRSDRVGRRPVLLAAVGLYTVTALACTLATSGAMLVATRLVQGIGAGACAVISFAVVQDLFTGEAARIKRAYVAVMVAVMPILAPAIGSVLTAFAGWRSVHAVLVAGGVVLGLVAWSGFGESRPARRGGEPAGIGSVLRDGPFVAVALSNALSYAAIFTYIAGSPLVIVGVWRLPPFVFPAVFAATAISLTGGALTSSRLARLGMPAGAVVRVSLLVQVVAGIALAICNETRLSHAVLLAPLLAVLFARGVIAPNLQHLAIERGNDQAGVASAALGVSQLFAGAVASGVVAWILPALGARAIALPLALLASAALLSWVWADWLGNRKNEANQVVRD